MRQLVLHVSALNDDEYLLYTSSIADLVLDDNTTAKRDDAYYENLTVGVREARAWLRGRYSDIPIASIDAVRDCALVSFAPMSLNHLLRRYCDYSIQTWLKMTR